MESKKLDDTVQQFKEFVNNHPLLIVEIRKSGRSWQEYYEQWVLLGEEDVYWDQFKKDGNLDAENSFTFSKDQYKQLFNQFIKVTEKIDLNKVQKQVGELNSTIQTIDQLLNQFLDSRHKPANNDRPFHWFRD